ncbi:hypothetical protein [Brucella intermedia]|uniref:Uncharacterized protein n=1 Tax=Brucella intermedia M86 TaxID=1234597 RepID=M5JSX0_9HYPH|nr:hypothetical protein [Brucella intermedia]ELT51248.1 hypothetical protein D584_00325 [Brucella intermedia M86]
MNRELFENILFPSVNCLHLHEAGEAYITQLYRTLDEMAAKREEMMSQNVSRSDRRFVAFEEEWACVLTAVDAMADLNTKAWSRLNTRPLTPAP